MIINQNGWSKLALVWMGYRFEIGSVRLESVKVFIKQKQFSKFFIYSKKILKIVSNLQRNVHVL